jgi:hypothetical protein
VTDTALATTAALDRLKKSSARSTLDDLVAARTRRSLLLVDCSGSMTYATATGERRIDALRKVVDEIRKTHNVPVASFGHKGNNVALVNDSIPEPGGSTPIDRAIAFGQAQEATHLMIVTDGEPNSEAAAFDAARAFGGRIDCFFVGDPNTRGAQFCAELAKLTGGSADVADLSQTKHITAGIVGLLGPGGDEAI